MTTVSGRVGDADQALAAAPSSPAVSTLPGGAPSRETWQSINQWCDDTFGKATIAQIIARAKEEFNELEEPHADHAIEAADVVICLCRIPGFADALQRKMAINRKRKWRLTGVGTGYHIPRDTDGSPEGRDAQRLDGEATTAGAEGIAHPLSKDSPHA